MTSLPRVLLLPLRVASLASIASILLATAPRAACADDKADAAALFAEAGRLVEAGQTARACPKYEESLKLYEGLNTRYFLADCYEHTGKMASASALFLEVAARARAAGEAAKEEKARERAAAIQGRVSRVTVIVDAAKSDGLEVKWDGAPLARATWGVALPVDAGEHAVEASAPGKKPWRAQVAVKPEGETATVSVPELEGGSPADAAGPHAPADTSADGSSPHRTIALVVGGIGLAGLGIGTALGLGAKARFDEASDACNGDRCDQRGVDIRESAVQRANVATVVFGVGLAALVGGGVLWLTAPRPARGAAVGVTPTVGGVLLRGTF